MTAERTWTKPSFNFNLICTFLLSLVLPGSGSAAGASYHGAGATGQRAGRLSSGRHALPACLFPGQECRLMNEQKHDACQEYALCCMLHSFMEYCWVPKVWIHCQCFVSIIYLKLIWLFYASDFLKTLSKELSGVIGGHIVPLSAVKLQLN